MDGVVCSAICFPLFLDNSYLWGQLLDAFKFLVIVVQAALNSLHNQV